MLKTMWSTLAVEERGGDQPPPVAVVNGGPNSTHL